MGVKL